MTLLGFANWKNENYERIKSVEHAFRSYLAAQMNYS